MGKKKRSGKSRQGSSSGPTKVGAFGTTCRVSICRYSGSLLMNPVLAAGANTLGLNPNVLGTAFSAVLLAFSQLFTEFRFRKLMFRVLPQSTNNVALAYQPEIASTPATTIGQALQTPYSVLVGGTALIDNPIAFTLTSSVLMSGASKWWKCVPTAAADDWDELQGLINFVPAAGTPSMNAELYYTIEFTGPSTTAAGLFSPTPRRSLVHPDWRAIDLIIPGKPFVDGKSVDDEWLRVKKIGEDQDTPSKRERNRLITL